LPLLIAFHFPGKRRRFLDPFVCMEIWTQSAAVVKPTQPSGAIDTELNLLPELQSGDVAVFGCVSPRCRRRSVASTSELTGSRQAKVAVTIVA